MEFLENNKKLSENNQTTNNTVCNNIDNNVINNVSTESKIETKMDEVKEDTSLNQEVQKVNPFEELELEKITTEERKVMLMLCYQQKDKLILLPKILKSKH